MKFDTKFRMNEKISLKKELIIFNDGIDNFIKKQSYNKSISLQAFFRNITYFILNLTNFINSISCEYQKLNNDDYIDIKDLQDNFIFCYS